MRKLWVVALLSLVTASIAARAEDVDDGLKISGMPSLAGNTGNAFMNFGGPSLKFEYGRYFWGAQFFPSLRHNAAANEISPILGIGFFAGHERVFLIVPSYYYGSAWYAAIGAGYKF